MLVRVLQRNSTNRMYVYLKEKSDPQSISIVVERETFEGIGSRDYEDWQVQNFQGRLAIWRPRED